MLIFDYYGTQAYHWLRRIGFDTFRTRVWIQPKGLCSSSKALCQTKIMRGFNFYLRAAFLVIYTMLIGVFLPLMLNYRHLSPIKTRSWTLKLYGIVIVWAALLFQTISSLDLSPAFKASNTAGYYLLWELAVATLLPCFIRHNFLLKTAQLQKDIQYQLDEAICSWNTTGKLSISLKTVLVECLRCVRYRDMRDVRSVTSQSLVN